MLGGEVMVFKDCDFIMLLSAPDIIGYSYQGN